MKTAETPRATERIIFKKAKYVSPFTHREWVSLAKVEKVVKPPRNPVARRGMTH